MKWHRPYLLKPFTIIRLFIIIVVVVFVNNILIIKNTIGLLLQIHLSFVKCFTFSWSWLAIYWLVSAGTCFFSCYDYEVVNPPCFHCSSVATETENSNDMKLENNNTAETANGQTDHGNIITIETTLGDEGMCSPYCCSLALNRPQHFVYIMGLDSETCDKLKMMLAC